MNSLYIIWEFLEDQCPEKMIACPMVKQNKEKKYKSNVIK